jgi:hypothetical protein
LFFCSCFSFSFFTFDSLVLMYIFYNYLSITMYILLYFFLSLLLFIILDFFLLNILDFFSLYMFLFHCTSQSFSIISLFFL